MHTFSRLSLSGALLALFLLAGAPADAAECTEDNLHGCWRTLSGPNYSQVAVGATPSGVGIACAVTVTQQFSWGGVLHCFAPVGTSGAVIRGRGGEEAQNPGPFSSSDESKRIVSLAIRPVVPGPLTHIYALRSDGQLFVAAVLTWPYAEGADPRIYFSADNLPLAGIREIAWAPGTGLVATTHSNQRFVRNGSGWSLMSGTALLLAGNNDSSGHAFFVSGTRGPTTLLGNFVANWSVPFLPGLLPSAAGSFGRGKPLTVGADRAYALLPGSCSGGSALTPCIFRAGINIWNHSWGSWNYFPTADFSGIQGTTMPWTIQDGSKMRGVPGELWVIGGGQHLKFWAP